MYVLKKLANSLFLNLPETNGKERKISFGFLFTVEVNKENSIESNFEFREERFCSPPKEYRGTMEHKERCE